MKRKDFLINGGILGFAVLFIPQILSCKNKLHLEVLIGQGTDILKQFEKTGDEGLSIYLLPENAFDVKDIKADEAYVIAENRVIIGFRTRYNQIDDFLQIKQQLEKSLGKADNGYQNEFGMAQVWIKNGLKYELSKTFKTDLVKAYMFYSISKTKNQLLYF